jgi:hypothetical protein
MTVIPSLVDRRDLIRQRLLESPDKSDRAIATESGASRELVVRTRAGLEAAGLIVRGRRLGRDGKVYPGRRDGAPALHTPLRRRATSLLQLAARIDARTYLEASEADRALLGFALARLANRVRDLRARQETA